jgi:hypothetical protein
VPRAHAADQVPVVAMTDPPRYGRLRLDGDTDDLHRALAYLAADTCKGGCCDPANGVACAKHTKWAERRRLRAVPDQEAS